MIAVIPFIYLWSIPALIILSIVWGNPIKRLYSRYALQVINILMVVYAMYQIRLLIGLMQLFRSMNPSSGNQYNWFNQFGDAIVQTLIAILLPLVFLIPWFRKSNWFSLGVMLFYLNRLTIPDWNAIEWLMALAYFVSWFTFIYSLFWMMKWLRQ
jgi:hypothetical protein